MKRINLSSVILVLTFAAVIVPFLRYTVAFQQAEPPIQALGRTFNISLLTGAGFAITYEGLCAIAIKAAFDAWRNKLKAVPWWLPLPFAGGQILLGALIITPVAVAELNGLPVGDILGQSMQWVWSLALVLGTPLSLATAGATLVVRPESERDLFKARTGTAKTEQPAAQTDPAPVQRLPKLDKSAHKAEQVRTLLSEGVTDVDEIMSTVGCGRTTVYDAKRSRNGGPC